MLIGKIWVKPPGVSCETDCQLTLDVGMAQLTVGLAWHKKSALPQQSESEYERYSFAEFEAKARAAGFWSDPDAVCITNRRLPQSVYTGDKDVRP